MRKGFTSHKLPLPLVLGSDGAGEIVDRGKDVKGWEIGDKVVIQPGIINDVTKEYAGYENYSPNYGILGETQNGIQSEYVSLDPRNIYKMASHLSFCEAASMQLVLMTAHEMLVYKANLKRNETVLIYGGASGVGAAAIQIAKDLGAIVISTAGNNKKINFLKELGADFTVLHTNKNLINELKDITNGNGVDVVFEHIGYRTWQHSLKILNKGGRIVTCGATTGANVNIDLTHLFIKQQTIFGSTMAGINTFNQVMEKIKLQKYVPTIDKVFKFEDIQQAHSYIENRKNTGRVVLE